MNQARFNSIYQNLSAIAQKVYSAIPISDSWTAFQIRQEMKRLGMGVSREVVIIDGCINTLVNSGVVRESPKGSFRRVSITQKLERPGDEAALTPEQTDQPEATPAMNDKKPRIDPIEAISKISFDKLMDLQTQFADLAMLCQGALVGIQKIKDELEDVSIALDEQMKQDMDASKKFEQLQKLLKGIGDE